MTERMDYREWKAEVLERFEERHLDPPDEEEMAIHFDLGRTPVQAFHLITLGRGGTTCPRCEGTGKYRRFGCDERPCAVCNGTGLV